MRLLLPAMLTGCLTDLWEAPIIYQALDYTIDEPMIVGLAARPPVFVSGEEVLVEALILAPDGTVASSAEWKVCGLREDAWSMLGGLDCFADESEVQLLDEGEMPLRWTPPVIEADCVETCESTLPFIVETVWEGQVVQGGFNATLHRDWPQDATTHSMRSVSLDLSLEETEPGIVEVEAIFEAKADEVVFRWYVDGGELLGTGRTSGLYQEDVGLRSTNRWRVPEKGEGPWRVVVVVGQDDAWGLDLSPDTGQLYATPTAPDMTWQIGEWSR